MEREDEEVNGGDRKADGKNNEYGDYEHKTAYVTRRLMLAPKLEDET